MAMTDVKKYRLPTVGETIQLQGLVSASDLNGAKGKIVRYERDARRYRVKLSEKRQLAVKPQNIMLVEEDGPSKRHEWNSRLIHVMIPCHINNERRYKQFGQCVRSVACQIGRCRILVGVSGPTKEMRQQAMDRLRVAATLPKSVGTHHQWYVYEETAANKKSQFEHFQSLLPISMELNPNAWLMFLDNDDLYHPERVHFFQSVVQRLHPEREIDGFFSGGKLLIDDEKTREKFGNDAVLMLDQFLDRDQALNGLVFVAATAEENAEMDVTEYFDFCVRSCVLHHFLEITPPELLSHSFCDVRFLSSIARMGCRQASHPDQEWLLMHYQVRQYDRHQAFKNDDTEKYQNALTSVLLTEEDRRLSEETGLSVEMIAVCRKDIEEAAIQAIERDDASLEHDRKRVVPRMDNEFGYRLGSVLWEATCKKFSSYFSREMAEQNRKWFQEGKGEVNLDLEKDLSDDAIF